MPTEHWLRLSFEGAEIDDANRFAAELAEQLRDADPPIDAKEIRIDPRTQDFGATLVLVLGAPAVIALAKGLSGWLTMRPNAKVTLKRKDDTVIASGLTSADARAVIEQRLGSGG